MKYTALIMFLTVTTIACTSKAGQKSEENSQKKDMNAAISELKSDSMGLPADFVRFYERFHTDTSYQMEHITFPLMGLPANADTVKNLQSFRYHREDWVMHKPFHDPFGDYQKEYAMPTDDIVVERFVIPKVGLYIERRFAKLEGGEWYLIYYANVNRMPGQ